MDKITEIPNCENWQRIERINKGWSDDVKYHVIDKDGNELLLRLSDISKFDNKQAEYNFIKLINKLGFSMSEAVDFGVCNGGKSTYMLLSWVDGKSLDECISSFPIMEQYELGIKAGRILKQIHSIPVNDNLPFHWETKMKNKIVSRINDYKTSDYRVKGDEAAILYVRENVKLIDNVKKVYQHGDFHMGNLVLTDDKNVGVIDFNRWDIGDFVEEFYKTQSFDRESSIPFARGKIDGYFDNIPPLEFWERHALYVAYSSLFSIIWSIPFGKSDVESMITRCQMALNDYDNFNIIIPRWYKNIL